MRPDRRRPSPRRPRALSPQPGPRVGAAAAVGAGEGNAGRGGFFHRYYCSNSILGGWSKYWNFSLSLCQCPWRASFRINVV